MKITDFAENYPSKKYPKGATFFNESETPKTLYYLKQGYVRRFIAAPDGKELTIHIFEKGSIFPLSWALYDEIPCFNLEALSQIELKCVKKSDFINFIKNYPEELLKITKNMVRATEGLAKRVQILSLARADNKLMAALSYLERHFGKSFEFTHEELSALTGLSRERVSIEMKTLKDKGIVSYQRGRIKITG